MAKSISTSGIRDNHTRGIVADFLKSHIKEGSYLSIVSAFFTIYAYEALAAHITAPMNLRAVFKGKTLMARVRRDGLIRFKGNVYRSPSLAAAAACKRPTCNGWTFWKYERAPGDWVSLNELRR